MIHLIGNTDTSSVVKGYNLSKSFESPVYQMDLELNNTAIEYKDISYDKDSSDYIYKDSPSINLTMIIFLLVVVVWGFVCHMLQMWSK